jgi:putative Ca2+/H+ antiporter (TMEM165/GDT1 family)
MVQTTSGIGARKIAVVILVAELPDKSMFVVLVLGTRFSRIPVMVGAAAGFAVHVVIAVLGGRLISLLPHRAAAGIVAVMFLAGAIWMFRMHPEADGDLVEEEAEVEARVGSSHSPLRIAGVAFGFVFLSEWGDITQLATASMAAQPGRALSVGIGATLGLWTAVLLAVTVGGTLLRRLPPRIFHRIAATALLIFAAISSVALVHG